MPGYRALMVGAPGGRTWWAHFEFTRINIAPTILRKKIEENLDVLYVESFSGQYRWNRRCLLQAVVSSEA
jgi:hypothetical protein